MKKNKVKNLTILQKMKYKLIKLYYCKEHKRFKQVPYIKGGTIIICLITQTKLKEVNYDEFLKLSKGQDRSLIIYH